MAEAISLVENHSRLKGRLRLRALLGKGPEQKACRAALENPAIFAAAAEYVGEQCRAGRLADWWAWLKDNWAKIVQYILSLLVLI